jgi:hypothetical protein
MKPICKALGEGLSYGGTLAAAALLAACGQQTDSNQASMDSAAQPEAAMPAAEAAAPADGPEARNMRLVGYNDLQGRSAYQPVVHRYGDRYILFVGHHAGEEMNPQTGQVEVNGMSVVDVTDPTAPVLLKHMPPSGAARGTQHVQPCDGSVLPNGDPAKTYLLRTNGQLSTELLDVTDPANPSVMLTVNTTGHTDNGRQQTHKIQWDCETGIAYLNGTVEGWRVPRVLQIYDLSTPEQPKHIRNFGLDGQQPGGDAPHTSGLHQPVVVGNRVYLGYESSGNGVLQILDRDKLLQGNPDAADPFAPTTENLLYPQIARLNMPSYYGVHTAKPIYDMPIPDYADNGEHNTGDFLLVTSEETGVECESDRDITMIIDVTEEDKPLPISNFQVPEEPGDFCHRGGRFGPHAPQDAYDPRFDKKLMLLSYFNGGIRAVDIRDPFHPTEVGYFIPQVTDKTKETCRAENDHCKVAIQTNNVNIDDRGYIYALDRAGTGLHIVELTGEAREIVGL